MKRLIIILSTLSIVLISCQQNLVPDQPEVIFPADEIITKSFSTGKINSNVPIVFLPATDMKAWTDIGPLQDRFAACEVPESRLESMTTEALVKSIMNYPLNFLVFVYDNPQDAIDIIIDNSRLHQELLSRTDAAECIVDLYSEARLDMSSDKGNFDGDYINLSYTNSMFLDHFLACKAMVPLKKSTVRNKLAEAVSKKIQERIADNETFSMFSVSPLLKIDETENLGVATSLQSRSSSHTTITIYTDLGYPVEGIIYEEMTADEMEEAMNDCTENYPHAIVRGSATYDYNCHSYAWYLQSTDNNVWVNSYDSSGNFQLSKFWTYGYYVGCPEESATHAHYVSDDHSAIRIFNNHTLTDKWISKWGYGPLMEHDLFYCPYFFLDIDYYCKYTTALNIQGQSPVIINQEYVYNITNYAGTSHLNYEWEVRFMDAPSPTPFDLYVDTMISGRTARLKCREYGYYKVIVRAYDNGVLVDTNRLEVLCLPS